MEKGLKLHDFVVLCVGLLVSLGVGMYYAFKERHKNVSSRYHRGDGKLGVLPVAASIVLTTESTIMMLGFPAEVYVHGFVYCWLNLGIILGFLGCFWVTIPLFHPLKLTSVTQYLKRRHQSVLLNQFLVAFNCLNMLIYSGIITFGTSIAIAQIIGIPAWTAIIVLVGITGVYTALGGIKAVVATDVVQGVIVVIFALGLLIYGTIRVGGVQRVVEINKNTGRLDIFEFDISPFTRHTFWTLVIGTWLTKSGNTVFQPVVQRISSTKTAGDARKVIVITLIAITCLHLIFMSHGLVAFAYFSETGCDPLASNKLNNPNQIVPFMVLTLFDHLPGVTGFFLADLCSVLISTLSSILNSISAMISIEFILVFFPAILDRNLIRVSKFIVFITGAACIFISILFTYIKGPLTQIAASLIGAVNAPVVTIYFLSIFFKFITVKGLVASTMFGYFFGLWIAFGYNFSEGRKRTPWMELGPTEKCDGMDIPLSSVNTSHAGNISAVMTLEFNDGIEGINNLYSISYLYFTLLVLMVTVPTCLFVSWLTKPKGPKPIPEHLMLRFGMECLKCTTKNPENNELAVEMSCFAKDEDESFEL